jgi:hypothetical protein
MSLPAVPPVSAPKEPLVSVTTITLVTEALIALVAVFGFKLSADKTAAILGFEAVAAPIIIMIIGRLKVFSPATVRAMVLNARK